MAFVPFASVDRGALRWQRTVDTPMEFTLSSGEKLVARLRWAHSGGSLATVELAGATWSVERGGFLNPHLIAREGEHGPILGRLTAHMSHHTIELPTGVAYRFHRAGILVPAWTVSRADGQEVLHLEPVREGRKLEAGAVIPAADATSLPELLLLTVLAWHFIVLAWFEDEALVPLEGS